MNEIKLNLFFEHYGVAFWILYLLFPFFLRIAMPRPLYTAVFLALTGAYLYAMHHAYQTFAPTRLFIIDALCLVLGLAALNWFVFFGPVKSTAMDLTAYTILAFSFAPTAFRLESHKRGYVV